MTPEIRVREERPGDESGIRRVNLDAFDTPSEADLVDRLRASCNECVSLVALDGGTIVGHILLTPAIAEAPAGEAAVKGMGLAPMAVLSSHQRRGIGDSLARAGIEKVKAANYPFIVVLGHAEYYPRFGFERASLHGARCEFPGVPDEYFMLMPLDAAIMRSVSGVIRYRPEFAAV